VSKEIINNLIKFIVGYATQNETSLTTLRLVKFIYLADLYYARKHSGKKLTGFPWAFVNYGPYCHESLDAIQRAELNGIICKKAYESKFGEDEMYNIYSCSEDTDLDEIEDEIPHEVLSSLRSAIKKYGDDTPFLLDYVYFETEPMANARKGDLLDFTKAKPLLPVTPIKLKKIPQDKINLAKSHIKTLGKKLMEGRSRLEREKLEAKRLKDDLYYEALEMLEGKDLETNLQGVAKIEV
jgi:hypothetical protein